MFLVVFIGDEFHSRISDAILEISFRHRVSMRSSLTIILNNVIMTQLEWKFSHHKTSREFNSLQPTQDSYSSEKHRSRITYP